MKLEEFFEDLGQSIDEVWNQWPPRIELKGWWWKRYIPHYRRVQKIVQQMVERQWIENQPNIGKELEQLKKEEISLDETFKMYRH